MAASLKSYGATLFGVLCLSLLQLPAYVYSAGITRHIHFEIKLQPVTRLCHEKDMMTMNGQFPGPSIVAGEGDRLLIEVVNHSLHGVRQFLSRWANGPAYILQCPLQNGQSYIYNFTVIGQRGTLFWHTHVSGLRTTIYGPILIYQKPGEWFNGDTEAIISQALQTGGEPNISDAHTMNGLPGPLCNCSANDPFKLLVRPGKTYLLRLINAALNDRLFFFFSIANHTLTLVEVDAVYIKPFETETLLIAPGQTTDDVLLRTKSNFPNATFFMMARPYVTGPAIP